MFPLTHQGEKLEPPGVQDNYILSEDEGLVLKVLEGFVDKEADGTEVVRRPGDKFMLRGPLEYVPPVEVEAVQRRSAIPLDVTEGVYIRSTKTGRVRAHIGSTVLLDQYEELYQKELSPLVEDLLSSARDPSADRGENTNPAPPTAAGGSSRRGGGKDAGPAARDKTRVVTYRVPSNSCVQIYDYQAKKARVVFGPDLVMLAPDEQFTVTSHEGVSWWKLWWWWWLSVEAGRNEF